MTRRKRETHYRWKWSCRGGSVSTPCGLYRDWDETRRRWSLVSCGNCHRSRKRCLVKVVNGQWDLRG